jgi:glutamate/aspartate transport system substrate-binding protein
MIKSLYVAAIVAAALVAGGATAQAPSAALSRIKSTGTINIAYSPDSPPFSFDGPDKSPVGYSIDLCKRVVTQIGRAVGAEVKVNWMPASVSDRLQMVASGRADMDCANTSQTLTRLGNVDFSSLIFIDAGGMLVIAGGGVNALGDLAGKRIAVLKGTTTETSLNAALKLRLVNATVVPIGDALEGVRMLESGDVQAYAGDKIKLVGLATQAKDPSKLAMLNEDMSFEPYALALPRNDSPLRLEVNRALTQVYNSDDIESIFARWLGKLGRPTTLLVAMYRLNTIPQ